VTADPLVSIIIVTHNSQDDIVDCVNSVLLSQRYYSFEVIIVDNASTDKTVEKIEENFANNEVVSLIKNGKNSWYSGGNNLGCQKSKGELIVILNPDLIVDKFWLSALVEAYRKHENAGIVGSNVLLFDKPDIVNACGNDIHLTGFVFARFYGEHTCEYMKEEVVAAPSGASFIFSRDKLKAIGRQTPFDTTRFFMDCSDADLALEFLSRGFLSYVCPSSKVFHKFKFKMNPDRLFILETARYQILGHFRKKTLFMMLPALIVTELIVWSFILIKDRQLIKSKMKVQLWLLSHLRNIFRSNNSAAKDLRLVKQMVPDIKLYNELSGSSHSVYVENGIKASNRLFRFTRQYLINSLSMSVTIADG
jgi:GT2 family glycosyltransferase